jgi:hypothetical protein
VAMVKKCYQYIKDAEATAVEHIIYWKVIQSVDDETSKFRTYRQIVKDFDYGKLLKDLKRPTDIKNEQIDQIVLTMILVWYVRYRDQELEK